MKSTFEITTKIETNWKKELMFQNFGLPHSASIEMFFGKIHF